MGRRTKKVGIAGTLRHLYGATLRKRWAAVVSKARAKYRCPRCQAVAVKRVAAGIWQCRKCGYKYVAEADSGENIFFTSEYDDSWGGDTNNDGSSTSPSPGNWDGVYFNDSTIGNNSVLNRCNIRYASNAIYFVSNVNTTTLSNLDITNSSNVFAEEAIRIVQARSVLLENIEIIGNVKFDSLPEQSDYSNVELRHEMGIPLNLKVLVAGSTRSGEEEILAESFTRKTLFGTVRLPRQLGHLALLLSFMTCFQASQRGTAPARLFEIVSAGLALTGTHR